MGRDLSVRNNCRQTFWQNIAANWWFGDTSHNSVIYDMKLQLLWKRISHNNEIVEIIAGWLSFKTCQMQFFKQIAANFVNLSFVRILLWASTDICKQCPFTWNIRETANSNFHRKPETCFGWKSARPIQIEHGQFWTPDYSSEELPSHHPSLLPLSPPPSLPFCTNPPTLPLSERLGIFHGRKVIAVPCDN